MVLSLAAVCSNCSWVEIFDRGGSEGEPCDDDCGYQGDYHDLLDSVLPDCVSSRFGVRAVSFFASLSFAACGHFWFFSR
jgi:hypothetical protein